MFLKGEDVFYVTGKGEIHQVVTTENERNGAVPIKGKSIGEIPNMGTLHLCRTQRAANITARNRKPSIMGVGHE